jgi:uncharacterized protein (TIGR02246 family)
MRKVMSSLIGTALVVGIGLTASVAQQVQTKNSTPKAATATAAPSEAEKAVRAVLRSFGEAFNKADLTALVAMFHDDAAIIDSEGTSTRGREAITQQYTDAFATNPGIQIEAQTETVRFLTPDVAQAEGQARLSTPGAAIQAVRFSALIVKRDGPWKLAELRDYPGPVKDITPYERLKELEWIVGDWVDENEDAKVTSSIRWADNQSYLVRTYSVEIQGEKAMSGTMFIGWDPQTGQIKSWVFDSEGGHGEGYWIRANENQWIVKAQGTLRDGRPTSATQIHTILNKDAVKTSSIDRIIGGEIAPDIEEIVMVRKPPQPGAGR